MYKEVLRSIEGIGIYPIISFVIFFVFFIGLGIYILKMKRSFLDKMENLPLEEDDPEESNSENKEYDEHISK